MTAVQAAGPGSAAAGGLRGALLRFGLLALIVGVLALLLLLTPASRFLERETLVALLADLRQAWWAPLALVASYLLVSPSGIPVSPLMFAGGAIFGPFWGWIYNLAGCLLGALESFVLASTLGKELVEHLAGERRMRQVESLLERHGFWSLVGVRFLPVPFALINFGAALSGFRFGPFMLATLFGLVPSVFMWNYLAHALVSAATEDRAALLRNAGVVIGLVTLLVLLRPVGRALLRRNSGGGR